jgi:hypothetical protein
VGIADLMSADTDLALFPGLRWRNPIAVGERARSSVR